MRRLVALILLLIAVTPNAMGTSIDMTPRPALLLRGDRFLAQDSWDCVALYESTGQLLRRFPVGAPVQQFDLTTDEKFLLVGCRDGSLSLWDTTTGAAVWRRTHDYLFDLSFSQNGERFVVCRGEFASVCETATGDQLACLRFPLRLRNIESAGLSADGTKGILLADERLFAFDTQTTAMTDTGLTGTFPVRYSPDGLYAVLRSSNSGDDEWLRVAELRPNPESTDVMRLGSIGHIRWKDGRFLVTSVDPVGGKHHAVGICCDNTGHFGKELWNIERGNQLERMDFDPATMRGVYTDFRLVTRLVDLRTGATLVEIDNSANYQEEIFSASNVFCVALPILAGSLVLIVLFSIVMRRGKPARA
jgi:hypothetical protein